MCIYSIVEVEWDATKAVTNLRKHGIDFADAATVLHDEHAITIEDEGAEDELRWVSLGMDALSRVTRGRIHVAR